MNERIKAVRKALDLTMEQFGDKIGLTKASVSRIESGISGATDQTVKSICREFHVSESWLRTGEGEMFDQTRESVLDRLTAEYALDREQRAVIESFLDLTPPERDAVLKYIRKVYAHTTPAPAPTSTPDIDAEVEAYRQELLSQKRAQDASSAFAGSGAVG